MKYLKYLLIFSAFLSLSLFSKAQVPSWAVNPSDYQYSQTITAVLNISTIESTDGNDIVATFSGSECRGVASPIYVTALNRWLVYMLVYSNTSGETLSFKIYDKSANITLNAINSTLFVNNSQLGTSVAPYIISNQSSSSEALITAFSIPSQISSTITGNTISVVMPAGTALTALTPSFTASVNALIKVGSVVQSSGVTINNFSNPLTYNVLSEDANVSSNYTVNVSLENHFPTNISLSQTAISESTPSGSEIATITATDIDLVQNQTFSLVAGTGSTNNNLFSISGNKLFTASSFDFETKTSYNIRIKTDDNNGGTFEKAFVISITDVITETPNNNTPVWAVDPSDYQYSMSVTAVLNLNNIESKDENDIVAAFSGSECRGVASPIYVSALNRWIVYMLVFSNNSGESLNFKIYDNSADVVINATNTIVFSNNSQLGTSLAPYIIATNGLSSEALISAFSIPGQISSAITGNTISVVMPTGTSLTALKPSFTASVNAVVKVDGAIQSSNITINDFTNSLIYNVLSEDATTSSNYTVNVSLENHFPTDISLSQTTIPETTPSGSEIATITATDIDAAQNQTFSLVTGSGSTNNNLFSISGNKLFTTSAFDFETKTSYNIRIKTNDNNGGTFEKAFLISITDVIAETPKINTPVWAVDPSNYQYSQTVSAVLKIDTIESKDAKDIVAAFSGNECRGVASPIYMPSLNRWIVYMLIYSNNSGETLKFKIYDNSNDIVLNSINSTVFSNNSQLGTSVLPFVIANLTITWPTPADIIYGTALSATQLNASAGIAGTFTYNPASGAIINAGNAQTLSVLFTPTDASYSTATKTVKINVAKATPVITWNNPADIVYGTALGATQLNATADVAGNFVYSPVSGTVLTVGNAQNLDVTFTPTVVANYTSATKTVQINVLMAPPVATAATNITLNGFTANWNVTVGATSYYLDVSTENTFTTGLLLSYSNLNVGNVTSYPVAGLNKETPYFYQVRAYNSTMTTGNSAPITVTTDMIHWNGTTWVGGAPTASDNITIAGNFNEIANIVCNNLTINNLSVLTINPNITVTVNGTLTNNNGTAGLVIKSDATGTGSLIDTTASVPATVERYALQNRTYYFSSAVANAKTNSFTGTVNLFKYDAAAGIPAWAVVTIDNVNELTPGIGFAVKYTTNVPAIKFIGNLNSGEVSPVISHNNIGFNWNLVGNPYPSAVDWGAEGWTKTNISNAVYVRTGANTVATYSGGIGINGGSRYLAIGQAFWIRTTANAPVLSFTNSVRLHRTINLLKGTDSTNILRMVVETTNYSDEIAIALNDNATNGIDDFDAYKMFSNDNSPELYTLVDNKEMAINQLSASSMPSQVSLGVKSISGGTYTLRANLSEFGNYTGAISLKDNLLGTRIDLRTMPTYTFTSAVGSINNRFAIEFTKSTTAISEVNASKTQIFAVQNEIHVRFAEATSAQIDVVDLMGRTLISKKVSDADNTLTSKGLSGVYLVKVKTETGNFTEKVFLQ